jgi:hypothetical protein
VEQKRKVDSTYPQFLHGIPFMAKESGPLELVERKIPEPGDIKVRIKIRACGICHGDSVTKVESRKWNGTLIRLYIDGWISQSWGQYSLSFLVWI